MSKPSRPTILLFALCAIPLGCSAVPTGSAQSPNTPGGTGRTTVIGSTSTVAGDAAATNLQQKWPYGSPR